MLATFGTSLTRGVKTQSSQIEHLPILMLSTEKSESGESLKFNLGSVTSHKKTSTKMWKHYRILSQTWELRVSISSLRGRVSHKNMVLDLWPGNILDLSSGKPLEREKEDRSVVGIPTWWGEQLPQNFQFIEFSQSNFAPKEPPFVFAWGIFCDCSTTDSTLPEIRDHFVWDRRLDSL